MRKIKRVLVNVALFLCVLLVCLCIVEVGLRLTIQNPAPLTKYHPYYEFTYNPAAHELVTLDNTTYLVSFNERGFWGPLSAYSYATNKSHRILVLGDSFTGQTNLGNYSSLYGEQLQAMYADVDVVTLGVGSWGPDNEYKVLEREGDAYHPDVIVVSVFMNDISDAYKDNILSDKQGVLVDHTPIQTPFVRKVLFFSQSHSYLVGLFVNTMQTHFTSSLNKVMSALHIADVKRDSSLQYSIATIPDAEFFAPPYPQSVSVSYEKTHLLFQQFTLWGKNHNATVIFMLIPLKEQIDGRKATETLSAHPTLAGADFSRPYNELKTMLAHDNATVLDLAPIFSSHNTNNSFYFETDGHWNLAGHTLAAQSLCAYLNKRTTLACPFTPL